MKIKEALKSKSQRKWWVFMVGLFFLSNSITASYQAISYFLFKQREPEVFVKPGDPIDLELKELLQNYVDGETIKNMFFFTYIENYTQRVLYSSANSSSATKMYIEDDPVYSLAYEFHKYGVCYVKRVSELEASSDLRPQLVLFLDGDKSLIGSSFYMSCPVTIDNVLVGYISAVVSKSNNGVIADMNLIQYIANRSSVTLSSRFYSNDN